MKKHFQLYIYLMLLVLKVKSSCLGFGKVDSKDVFSLPSPKNIILDSSNLDHILQWSPGSNTPVGTVYNVLIDKHSVKINDVKLNLSKYMKDIFKIYIVELWASYGNRSSAKQRTSFTPYSCTRIGPPFFNITGCGNCLNISISLPHPVHVKKDQFRMFDNNVKYDIYLKKVGNEKVECNQAIGVDDIIQSYSKSYVIKNLEPDKRYCVQIKPVVSSDKEPLRSCWKCEFTSKSKERVAFLAGWLVGFVLLGLVVLILTFCLVYTGFLCKPQRRHPKALTTFIPGYVLSPEKIILSTAEVACTVAINQLQNHHWNEKIENGVLARNLNVKEKGDEEEEEEDEEESQCDYMDRAANHNSSHSDSGISESLCKIVDNSDECSSKEMHTEEENTEGLLQLQQNCVNSPNLKAWPSPPQINPKLPELKKQEKKEGHVNLCSVILMSMHQKNEEKDETTEVSVPLLHMFNEPQCNPPPTSNTESPLLTHTAGLIQPDIQTSQTDQSDISDTSICRVPQTGYMATHAGTIGSENDSSESENEEDCNSGYMTR